MECCGNEVRRELTKALGVEAALNLCELPGARKAVKAWVAWRCCATVLPDHFAPGRPCRFENGSRAGQDWYVVSCASPQCHGECSTLRRQPSCPEAVSWRQHWASQMYLHIYIYILYIYLHPIPILIGHLVSNVARQTDIRTTRLLQASSHDSSSYLYPQ